VVVVDDIDRLSTSEIRDVFKLVRLTASFPNIIYLVAFDRGRVEMALSEEGVPGRDYLEKILQVAVDLPAVPDQVLLRQIYSAINAVIATIERTGPLDEQVWPDIFAEIIRPLIRNMRDVRRYVAAVHGTVSALDGQVAFPDVLALEAIRVFLPDVFARLHGTVDALTTTSPLSSGGREETLRLKSQIDGLIHDAGAHGKVVRDMVERLFPAASRHIGGSHFGNDWMSRWLSRCSRSQTSWVSAGGADRSAMCVRTATTSTPRRSSGPRAFAASAPSLDTASSGATRVVVAAGRASASPPSGAGISSGAGYQVSRTLPSGARVARPKPMAPCGCAGVGLLTGSP